jgi:uncharacterized Zn finger protein
MNSLQDQPCPLCGTDASFESIAENRKHFLCTACGEFVIAPIAESQLVGAAIQIRERFSKRAKEVPAHHLLVIARGPLSANESATIVGEVLPLERAFRSDR